MRLLFLGKLADLAGSGERVLETGEALGWDGLIGRFDAPLAEALQGEEVRAARNGELLTDKRALVAGPDDEIAFLPPVSGG